MKQIAVFCVNYNSYKELDNYIKSLEKASDSCADVHVDVFVVDNTDKNFKTLEFNSVSLKVHVFPYHENIGYFRGIAKGMSNVDVLNYDFIIISNVDVLVSEDFFIKLSEVEVEDNLGVIAPDIYSITEKKRRNPGRISRYKRSTLKFWLFMYSHPLLYSFYYKYVYSLRNKKQIDNNEKSGEIYLAHGSFIILTREYFKRCGMIDYPIFLYCEELYIAELCRDNNLKTVYNPAIKVTDIDHVSTSQLKFKNYCRYNYEAITYILSNYMKE